MCSSRLSEPFGILASASTLKQLRRFNYQIEQFFSRSVVEFKVLVLHCRLRERKLFVSMDRAYPGQNNQGLDPISRMSSVRYPSRGRRQGFGVAHATFRPPQPVIRPPPLWEHSESGSLGGAIRPQTTGLQKRPPPGSVLARLEARRLDLAANKAERKRILSKKKFAGFIFGCTNNTEQECLKRQLFGLPLNNLEEVTNVMPGTPLFLFNYDQRVRKSLLVDVHRWDRLFTIELSFICWLKVLMRIKL